MSFFKDLFRGSNNQEQTATDTVESDHAASGSYSYAGSIPPVAQDSDTASMSASDRAYADTQKTRPASDRRVDTMILSVGLQTLLGGTSGDIQTAAKQAVKKANKEGFVIGFEFNGQEVLARPGDDPNDVVARYMHDSSLPEAPAKAPG
jgi:hypothetical protein